MQVFQSRPSRRAQHAATVDVKAAAAQTGVQPAAPVPGLPQAVKKAPLYTEVADAEQLLEEIDACGVSPELPYYASCSILRSFRGYDERSCFPINAPNSETGRAASRNSRASHSGEVPRAAAGCHYLPLL